MLCLEPPRFQPGEYVRLEELGVSSRRLREEEAPSDEPRSRIEVMYVDPIRDHLCFGNRYIAQMKWYEVHSLGELGQLISDARYRNSLTTSSLEQDQLMTAQPEKHMYAEHYCYLPPNPKDNMNKLDKLVADNFFTDEVIQQVTDLWVKLRKERKAEQKALETAQENINRLDSEYCTLQAAFENQDIDGVEEILAK